LPIAEFLELQAIVCAYLRDALQVAPLTTVDAGAFFPSYNEQAYRNGVAPKLFHSSAISWSCRRCRKSPSW